MGRWWGSSKEKIQGLPWRWVPWVLSHPALESWAFELREQLLPCVLGMGPGSFPIWGLLGSTELKRHQKGIWAAPQGMGNFERTIITRLSAREVGDENSGDGGWHVLSLYCLPGVSALHTFCITPCRASSPLYNN